MKKTKLITLLGLSLLLVGCGNKTSDTGVTPTSDNKTSTSSGTSDELHTLSVEITGKKIVGETITFVAKLDNSPISPLSDVTYTCAETDAMDIVAHKATLKKAGTFSVTASYKNVTTKFDVVVEEETSNVITIAEALKAANDTPTPMTVRGVVTSTYGKGGTIDDGTGSITIYSWYSSKTDTGIAYHDGSYRLNVGDVIEVYGYVYCYNNGAAQIEKSYQNSSGKYEDLDDAYLIKVEDSSIKARDTVELDENGVKALTNADTGKMVSFKAKYVSGEPEAAKSSVTFTVGSTKIYLNVANKELFTEQLMTYWNSLDIVVGDEVTITTCFLEKYYSKYNFGFYSFGTSVTLTTPHTYANPTSVSIANKPTSVEVGTTLSLNASVLPADAKQDVKWTSSDTSVATIDEDGLLIASKSGTTTIKAAATKDETIYDTFELTVTGDKELTTTTLTPSTLATTTDFVLTDVTKNTKYNSEFDIAASTGKIITAETLSDFIKLEISVYGTYDNLKVYGNREGSGTAVSSTSETSSGGKIYTYLFDKAAGITISNTSSHTVNAYSITAYYLK